MGMRSSLYECSVMHHRKLPVRHRFQYRLFMFCLDLDEIDRLSKSRRFLSRNRWNLFSFNDRDHLQRGHDAVKENIIDLLRSEGINHEIGKIFLITHLRTFGYVFNPVSFYFCFDRSGKPLCAVAEVGNTFGETKPYIARFMNGDEKTFRMFEQKFFYISPFVSLDAFMDFRLTIPDERLNIRIDDVEKEERFLVTTLVGKRRPLTDARLLLYSLRFPLVTLQVIFKIHWQAFLLHLKRLPYHRKLSNIHLQREVYNAQ